MVTLTKSLDLFIFYCRFSYIKKIPYFSYSFRFVLVLDDVEGVGVCRELTQTPTETDRKVDTDTKRQTPTVTDRKVETDTKKTNTDRNRQKSRYRYG